MKKILCLNTAGKDRQDALRMRRLASRLDAEVIYYDIDRSVSRLQAMRSVWQLLRSQNWDLVYQEGTGIAGGINLIVAALTRKQAFVVSSGDPIAGFFRTTKGAIIGNIFEIYERLLYKTSAGFIGWTPYLTGVAIRLGTKRAVTVEGSVDLEIFYPYSKEKRLEIKQKYNIPADHLICGVIGSLIWVPTQSYCYGYELVEILKRIDRKDISFLVVGDGDGKEILERSVPEELRSRIVFTGRLPETEVVDVVNAMDIGFVTLFGEMGNYRLTTKLPEYLACGVPVAMTPTAAFYDYALTGGWALPEYHPATVEFNEICARWLDRLSWDEVAEKKQLALKLARDRFDYNVVSPKFCEFIHNLLNLIDKK